MTVYVYRGGEIVPKENRAPKENRSPYISRFESYESPIDDATISSHRQRDLDMHRSNSYDVRDIGENHAINRAKEARKAENERSKSSRQLDFWRDPD